MAAGKLTGEVFDKAVQASGRSHFEKLGFHVKAAAAACAVLEKRVDERFGKDAPSLKETREALNGCDELVSKLLTRLGGKVQEIDMPSVSKSAACEKTPSLPANAPATTTTVAAGPIANRGDAVRALREAAGYFRQNEPHSPVALLAERAANWAEMPLDEWLASVIKDHATLAQLRELLDIRDKSSA